VCSRNTNVHGAKALDLAMHAITLLHAAYAFAGAGHDDVARP
jgi:hypothetical protein